MRAPLEAKVLADKALRDTSKLAFDTRLAQVKLDLEARGVAGRVADEVVEQARVVYDEGAAVVQEHPGVVGGTIAALMLWILRNPIIGWLDALLGPRR
ncbi:hypothetical protein [Novosphingobium sp. 9U]|uniref:hypothetical protein n=1 Tax=Novosphingobium sp. 9U TaxID=2653158 RepID=UPI0012F09337|nr:hypothetical protein [Novosphingobium sp. 9U]VWX52088.1 conserved hypothetical protein [Novosphingobium sp. 9U]